MPGDGVLVLLLEYPTGMLGIIPGCEAQAGSLALLESLGAIQYVAILPLATKNTDEYKIISADVLSLSRRGQILHLGL